jgi:glycosyltransferase involved in cell wall biosynthesis
LALVGNKLPLVVARRVNFPLSRSRFTAWKYRRAQFITAISRAIQTTLQQAGIPEQRISIIPDGVVLPDLSTNTPETTRKDVIQTLAIPEGHKVVMCIANLSAEKDHETLLQAWKLVEAQESQALLLLIGDGERRSIIASLVSSLPLKACRLLGFRSDISELLSVAYVVVLSSREEGLGSILLEAQAQGVPVVATNAGGIPEAVDHNRTGLVVEVGDPTALATALLQVLHDQDLHQRFSAAARLHIEEHFSASRIIDQHLMLYRQLLAPSTTR